MLHMLKYLGKSREVHSFERHPIREKRLDCWIDRRMGGNADTVKCCL